MNAQPTGTLSLEPKASTSTPFRYLFNDLLPLKHDHVGRTLNCLLHVVLSTELTTCQVLGKHLPGELHNEESAEGMCSREAAIFSAFESMSVRKVIFLGSLRQVSGEEHDDRWSQNGEVRKKSQWFSRPEKHCAGSVLATRVTNI